FPGTQRDTAFNRLLLAHDLDRFYHSYTFDVRPVSDDRPFFFYTVQPRDLWNFFLHASRATADYKVNNALPVLYGVVAISIVATIIILSLPPILFRNRLPLTSGGIPALLFFLFLGAGYILIQVALIQKFVLFLGHPTRALTVIIFSMLVSSGVGSFVSKRLIHSQAVNLSRVLLTIVAGTVVLSFVVTPIAEGGVALPYPFKVVLSVALIAPLGFAMGMPFPSGLSLLEKIMPSSVRWAWAINAASSVLGSAAAIFFAIYFGLRTTLIIGGACYLAAWLSAMNSALRRESAIELPRAEPAAVKPA
ncbi:MAG: hypothetical protein JOZ62_14730, partial [Acidobacteriaceae bacterium]|nr:hypothetical protein [Acidobacteriaceae bacterium]